MNAHEETASANGSLHRDPSVNTLHNREQQLKDEIARLRREEQELREKDLWIKQNIVAVREKMMDKRH